MRPVSVVPFVLLSIAVSSEPASAQSLSFSVFERYLESVRVEAGIPGMSAAIIQDGVVVWERGMGRQDLETSLAATPETPYAIGQLSQIFGSTLLLRRCMDQDSADLTDRVTRWMPLYPEPATTLGQLLSHTAPTGGYRYAPERFASLTGVIEECGDLKYPQLLAEDVFELSAMFDSVPGGSVPLGASAAGLGPARLDRYRDILRRIAVPYHVVSRRAQRNIDFAGGVADAADGVVTTVRDLERFDVALDSGLLLEPATRALAFTQATDGQVALPTALGWFVQGYNGQPIVWQFGLVDGAYSSLMVKVPNRRLTFILLANSDGLSAPFALTTGDVTSSLFARLFLKSFVP